MELAGGMVARIVQNGKQSVDYLSISKVTE